MHFLKKSAFFRGKMSDFWFFFVRTSPSHRLDNFGLLSPRARLRFALPSEFLRSSFGVVSEWYRSGNGVCPLSLRYPSVRVRDKLYCQLSEIHVGILFLFAIHLVCSLCFVFEHLYERGGFYDSDIRSVCA